MSTLKIFILVAVSLLLAGCNYSAKTPATAPAPKTTEAGVTSVQAFNFGFNPATLQATTGETIQLSITSAGTHTFTIDELGVNQRLSSGANTVSFTPNRSGTFSYYCAISGHRERGMIGSLTVSAN